VRARLLALTTLSITTTALAAETEPSAIGSESCPRLFGDAATRAESRARRHGRLVWVLDDGEDVFVVHSTDWVPPVPIRFAGLTLLDAGPTSARIRVDEALSSPGCPAGTYVLEPDASVGPRARVLAVLDGLLLLEVKEQLRVLVAEGRPARGWRLVWRSDWHVRRPSRTTSSTTSTIRRPSARRKKKHPPPTKSRSR